MFRRWGVLNKTFACDTNAGSELLVGSFVPVANISNVKGVEVVIKLASIDSSWPAWWEFINTATCRQSSLTMNTTSTNPASLACPDWSLGNSVGEFTATYNALRFGGHAEAAPILSILLDRMERH
jgi:hypothetical protein